MTQRARLIFCSVVLFLSGFVSAQPTQFNYNGRVKVKNTAFTGEGLFKFSLVNNDRSITYWASDGKTLDGSEPTSAIATTVANGIFSVNIGDASTDGMAQLDASLFNDKDRVFLRVWFSDKVNGFEQMRPDREVVNPSFLGLQSLNCANIYVDPIRGDDRRSGVTTETSKQTIQAAWNALPTILKKDATIYLAEGVYYQKANLTGKIAAEGAKIKIKGNSANPQKVRINGALSEETSTTKQNSCALRVTNQKNLYVEGLTIENFKGWVADEVTRQGGAFTAEAGSYVFLNNVLCRNCSGWGIVITNHSDGFLENVEMDNCALGNFASFGSNLTANSCYVHNEPNNCWGLGANRNSVLTVMNTTVENVGHAYAADALSVIYAEGTNNKALNSTYGLNIGGKSVAYNKGSISISGCSWGEFTYNDGLIVH